MILNELLGQVEILTDIVLYESSSEHWDDTKETLIKKDITVADYYSYREKELYDKYSRCEIIGITIEKNALRITIYRSKRVKKKIGDLTLREVEKICQSHHKVDKNKSHHWECDKCPFNNGNFCISNDIQIDLDKEIEVEDDDKN